MKKILFQIGDGPEGITVWTDEDKSVINWADDLTAVYVTIDMWRSSAEFGPFSLINAERFLKALSDQAPEKIN